MTENCCPRREAGGGLRENWFARQIARTAGASVTSAEVTAIEIPRQARDDRELLSPPGGRRGARADVGIGPYSWKRLAVLLSDKRKRQELSFLPY